MSTPDYEQQLLEGWEEVYRKGQLTLWILLALKGGPKHMAEIKKFIGEYTANTIQPDDKSMYRALRRYYDTEIIDFRSEPGKGGPERKVYFLTNTGLRLLQQFIERNITSVYYNPNIQELLQ